MITQWIILKFKFLGLFKNKPIIGKNTFISSDSSIGDYTYVGKNCNVTKSQIGRYCSIADNVTIGPGEHNISKIATTSLFYEHPYEELTNGPCEIGNDVWIGVNSVIRRGVIIGNGAIVGANSFVNKNVPDFAVVVGTPAKIIKFRFHDEKTKLINSSKWWDFDHKIASIKVSQIEKS